MQKLLTSRNNLINKFMDHRLNQIYITEKNEDLFKPIMKSNKDTQNKIQDLSNDIKQITTVQNNIGNIMNRLQNITVSNKTDNSLFKEITETPDRIIYGVKKDKIIAVDKINGKIKFLNTDEEKDLTEGLAELLFIPNPDFNKITQTDYASYFTIYEMTGINPGKSNRLKLIKENQNMKPKIQEITGEGFKILPNKTSDLLDRLYILLSATENGHNTTYDEVNSILHALLDRKIIDEKRYKKILNQFF